MNPELASLSRERKKAHQRLLDLSSPNYAAFLAMEQAAYADGALPKMDKELIAVGISVVIDCHSCMELGISLPGEMETLADIARPDVAVIHNVGPAHLEGLGSIAGVAAAKTALFKFLRPGGTALASMAGVRLEVRVHIVTGAVTSAQNIIRSCHRAGLDVSDIVLESLASSKAVLTAEEREIGVALVDLGGGTTDLAIFANDSIKHTAVLALGGTNLTNDIAFGLRTPMISSRP